MSRIAELRRLLDQKNSQWILITDSTEVSYIAEFSSSNVALLCSKEKLYLFTDFRYREAALSHCSPNSPWEFIELKKSLATHIKELVKSNSTIGIQSDHLTIDRFEELKTTLTDIKFHYLGKEIKELLLCKESSEITAISEAAAIGDRSHKQLLPQLYYGISEYDVAQILEEICRKEGSEGPSFETIVLFGKRSALPHGKPSKEVFLEKGDFILTDFGCTVNGFCSDMTRTVVAGEASESQKEIYNTVLQAQRLGCDILEPDKTAFEIDKRVRDIIEEAGFGELFGHGTGHGVGRRIHERPALNKKDNTILKSGMVVTVEPGIYDKEIGGVRIEDLLLITEEGAKSLTTSDRELKIIL